MFAGGVYHGWDIKAFSSRAPGGKYPIPAMECVIGILNGYHENTKHGEFNLACLDRAILEEGQIHARV